MLYIKTCGYSFWSLENMFSKFEFSNILYQLSSEIFNDNKNDQLCFIVVHNTNDKYYYIGQTTVMFFSVSTRGNYCFQITTQYSATRPVHFLKL